MRSDQADDGRQGAPLPEVLQALHLELQEAARAAIALEAVLSPALAMAGSGSDLSEPLQSLDGLSQTLANLADFTAGLTAHAPTDVRIETAPAVSRISLSALAGRLAGRQPEATSASGELELF